MTFKDNPEYKEIFHSQKHNVRFYEPIDIVTGYHISRFAAASAQSIYASTGATPEVLNAILDRMIAMCNDTKATTSTLRTDIAILANNLKYRTKYPVDEDCAIRMAAIYAFIEGENPDLVNHQWTQKKVDMAKGDADLYAFFLQRGLTSTPAYRELSSHLDDSEYFQKRSETLMSLTPQQ